MARLNRYFSRIPFAVRLFGALAIALAVVGVAGFKLISDRLQTQEIARHLDDQLADVSGFEAEARLEPRGVLLHDIGEVLETLLDRPGVEEAILIGPDTVVRAAGEDRLVGTKDTDIRIEAALDTGEVYAGHEANSELDTQNFEFVTPLSLPSGRYALELSYSHESFDQAVAHVRHTLILVGIGALLAIGLLFYLVGGRSLIRAHALALRRATRDGLTDLPNHRAFQADLKQAAALAERHRDPLALALIDIDHFKRTNDRLGHPAGDAVLVRVADLLRASRSGDRVYRLGGDEFATLLVHADESGAMAAASRLGRALTEAGVAASLGVSGIRGNHPADELRAEADAALYEAKRRGGAQVVHFDEIRELVPVSTTAKRDAVAHMVEQKLMGSAFQPIWDLDEQRLLGIEALARPLTSGLGPAEAFDVAEQIGLGHELDELCVRAHLRNVPDLPEGALLFLNLTPKTLEIDSEDDDWLREAVDRSALEIEQVVIEVTERLGASTNAVISTLQRLRDCGFKIALDDVGTGNAGLEMLHRVAPEYVKLDRSIVASAAIDPTARAVLMAMATFGRQTGAFVIAEGIEDRETLEFLDTVEAREPGSMIQGGQGFGLGRPGPELTATAPEMLDVLSREPSSGRESAVRPPLAGAGRS
jgi:diguanylate cyclase (GGDEF)-like protein